MIKNDNIETIIVVRLYTICHIRKDKEYRDRGE